MSKEDMMEDKFEKEGYIEIKAIDDDAPLSIPPDGFGYQQYDQTYKKPSIKQSEKDIKPISDSSSKPGLFRSSFEALTGGPASQVLTTKAESENQSGKYGLTPIPE